MPSLGVCLPFIHIGTNIDGSYLNIVMFIEIHSLHMYCMLLLCVAAFPVTMSNWLLMLLYNI